MTDKNPELEKAHIGADVETFWRSNVGMYLKACAKRDEIEALRELADVNPDNKDTIYQLQLNAKVPLRVIKWIEQAISAGNASKYILEMESESF